MIRTVGETSDGVHRAFSLALDAMKALTFSAVSGHTRRPSRSRFTSSELPDDTFPK